MAEERLQVVQLSCKSCGSMLQSEGREVVFFCGNCGKGYALSEGELKSIKISYAAPKLQEPGKEIKYLPFWVLRADVKIHSRSATGGFFNAVTGQKGKTEGIVSFYVPGFEAPLETLKKLSLSFTKTSFAYDATDARGRSLKGCVHSEEFARGFADFILLSMEAEKPDTIRSISYSIDFKDSEILAIPFAKSDGKERDLLIGTEVAAW